MSEHGTGNVAGCTPSQSNLNSIVSVVFPVLDGGDLYPVELENGAGNALSVGLVDCGHALLDGKNARARGELATGESSGAGVGEEVGGAGGGDALRAEAEGSGGGGGEGGDGGLGQAEAADGGRGGIAEGGEEGV